MTDEELDEANRLEALSSYQALSVKVLLLSSGQWAIIYGERQLVVTPMLDEGWMRQIAQVEREAWESRRAQARVALAENIDSTEKTMEDLGL